MEKDYQKIISKMGRATTGNFRSTPLGIVIAESKLAPAGPLLDFRQACFAKKTVGPAQRTQRARRNPGEEGGRADGKASTKFIPEERGEARRESVGRAPPLPRENRDRP